jgi:N-acetylmuramoyl-L-alanine amidase
MSVLPSPNHGERRGGLRPELVVLHFTVLPLDEARARLCDPLSEVSVHWLIARDGSTEQLVDESRRAWHAGAGSWAGLNDINSRSIGIELENAGDEPFSAPQMRALVALLDQVRARWAIPSHGVIGHSDMAPGRKGDPGPRFDWRGLALTGHGLWSEEEGAHERPLENSLTAIGYPPASPEARLAAFRLHFRPWAGGPESAPDRARAEALARAFTRARS